MTKDEARAEALKLYREGRTIKQIARTLRRSNLTVCRWTDSAGITRSPGRIPKGRPFLLIEVDPDFDAA